MISLLNLELLQLFLLCSQNTLTKLVRRTIARAIAIHAIAAGTILQMLLKLGSGLEQISATQTGSYGSCSQHHT
jgi:hypothetical protein